MSQILAFPLLLLYILVCAYVHTFGLKKTSIYPDFVVFSFAIILILKGVGAL